jgi:hypothetical protein
MQDSLDFVIYSRLGHVAQHTYHRAVELIDEPLETVLCGFVLEQGSPCCDCLRFTIFIHLLHGKTKFICMEEDKQVG